MRLVDSHCHLDDEKFDADRAAVIERACAAGVTSLMAIGTGGGPSDLGTGVRLAEQYPFMFATIGVHPHDAGKAAPETFDRMRELAAHPKVLAIGRSGSTTTTIFLPAMCSAPSSSGNWKSRPDRASPS